jgi:hypothetical protein
LGKEDVEFNPEKLMANLQNIQNKYIPNAIEFIQTKCIKELKSVKTLVHNMLISLLVKQAQILNYHTNKTTQTNTQKVGQIQLKQLPPNNN